MAELKFIINKRTWDEGDPKFEVSLYFRNENTSGDLGGTYPIGMRNSLVEAEQFVIQLKLLTQDTPVNYEGFVE